jgi:serine/threonine protein kinase
VISHLLGDGAFGIVWRATDKQEGRDVAIKRMKHHGGGELACLMSEAAKISAWRGHKNIVGAIILTNADTGGADAGFFQTPAP